MSVRFDGPFRKKRTTRTETNKRERHLILYVPIERWLTDDKAEMDEDSEEMMFDVAEEAAWKRAMKCCSQD